MLPGMDTQQTRRVEGGRYSGGAAGHSSGSKIQTGGMIGLPKPKPKKKGGRAVAGAGRAQSGGNLFSDLKKRYQLLLISHERLPNTAFLLLLVF